MTKKIGIIGAGVTGLTAALDLARAGYDVTVAEAAAEPGGLVQTFPLGGTRLEKFYHHAFSSDRETVALIEELGLADRFLWRETPMGIFQNQRLMKFGTPMDLLRFTPLSLLNRIRFGLVILYLAGVKDWQRYEQVRAQDWIQQAFGRQAWDKVWGPLLHGKFGDEAPNIGLPWFYSRVHTRAGSRKQGMTKEALGYLTGSFQVLIDTLAAEGRKHGVNLRLGQAVQEIKSAAGRVTGWVTAQGFEPFDAVLSTPAPPALLPLLPADLSGDYWDRLRQIRYLGNVCAVLTVRRSLSPIYWMNIPDIASPFIAVIEHTNFIPPETYGGRRIVYLSSYLPVTHPRYLAQDEDLLNEYAAYLGKIVPGFTRQDILEHRVFRAPYAQPVVRAGYASTLVPIESPLEGLYLANMAQIYPEDRGMSYCIRLGRQAAAAMQRVGAKD